jgi:RNA polymerase sigma-70 factor (ECF subfamily)
MGMKDATDGDLVRRARGGEAAAFAELCRRHGSRARTLARRVLGADAEAEDVVQDALLAAFAGLARLREPERFGGWLYAIAVNLARMRVRARHPDGALAPAAAAPTPEEAVEQTERRGSCARRSPRCRTVSSGSCSFTTSAATAAPRSARCSA